MLEELNSGWWQTGGYALVALLSLSAAWRGRRSAVSRRTPQQWPAFWLATGVLFLAMTAGRLVDINDLITDFGKREAYASGWYESRRPIQSYAVGGVAIAWAIATLATVWRFPERRRRYLPIAIAIIGLVFFAAIRLISLHQVDSLLYRRYIGDVRVGVVAELFGLAIIAALTLRQSLPDRSDRPSGSGRPGRTAPAMSIGSMPRRAKHSEPREA